MLFKKDMTKQELMSDLDPLFYTCHPIGKIKMFADLFLSVGEDEIEAGDIFNQDNRYAVNELLKDCCKEIEFIVEISNKVWKNDIDQSEARKKVLEQILEEIQSRIRDPKKNLDLNAMSEKICRQLQLSI